MLGDHGLDLFIGREAALIRSLQPAIDPGKLGRGRVVLAFAKLVLDLTRQARKLLKNADAT
jgi:hypothetical protein